jgi:hypothetical protein
MSAKTFKSAEPNYHRRTLDLTVAEGKKSKAYSLPFGVFTKLKIDRTNKFRDIRIDQTVGGHAISFVLEDGKRGDFPVDFVLYWCDPEYDLSPLNQLKRALKQNLDKAGLSLRVLADALETSPAQVVRLLEENRASKHILQLFKLAELSGYDIHFSIKKKRAA